MSKLMIMLVVLLSLAVAGLFLAKHENASLRTSLDRANNVASEQQTTITMLKNQLHVALTRADKNELAQVALRQELENAAKREAQREKTITRLLNENEDFRRWYGADLPDAVRRLHQRPACTDASDCRQAKWDKLQRGVAEFSISLATGRADIYTETPVKVSGFKCVIDEQDWTITKVTHFLNNSGFTTSLELEVRLSDVEYETEDDE
ncbi:hypothetical protein MRB63_002101 [Escherichia coli]|nr:hypothetical protein [Escherichia coli]EIZ9621872.1 hypothetical protein [Escherichia coli]